MAGLEAIASSHLADTARGSATPLAQGQEPEDKQPVEPNRIADEHLQAENVRLPTPAIHARLNYDQDAEEVIVEILNPQTGEVLQRFPAEELPDDIRTSISDYGPLADTLA